MGYGGTDAPRVPPDSISLYGFKRAADDIAELARQLGLSRIILGGHDWGGLIASRIFLYHPSLVQAIFSVGAPYLPPSAVWEDHDTMIQSKPSFQYQRHFGSPEFEAALESKDSIRQLFNAVYGGRGPNGEPGLSTTRALTENWGILGKQTQLSDKEFDYYVDQFARNGLQGPLNWYRNRRQNYEDELPYVVSYSASFPAESILAILPDTVIDVPYLFIQSLKDAYLPPSMSKGMERFLPQLRRREVDAGHFSHVLAPEVVNEHIREWLDEEVFPSGEASKP
ncbi:hypothetical protein MMC22_003433 [Lobaria immixta]|nr:hypothetical protein [Lobaria immixta]